MPLYDRDQVLERTDLVGLWVELVGPVRKEGAAWKAPCPNPQHAQTGGTPPASIDPAGRLWHCFGCGSKGTAVDLVCLVQGVDVGRAIALLAERANVAPRPPEPSRPIGRPSPSPSPRAAPAPLPAARASEASALETYVDACADGLWRPEGAAVLAWLRARGFTDEVLRANRIGADPGATLQRDRGLPRPAVAAVFPVLRNGHAVYLQQRPLEPAGGRKYLNPGAPFGKSPRVACLVAPPESPGDLVLVCEGIPDALTAAGAGYRAVAILGAEAPDVAVAERLVAEFPTEHLVLALDGDAAGQASTDKLAHLLAAAGAGRRVWELEVPEWVDDDPKGRDLNGWAQAGGGEFAAQLRDTIENRATPSGWEPLKTGVDVLAAFQAKLDDPDGAVTIPTGIGRLDQLLAGGGWRPGVMLLGGLPGIGKTAFAMQASLIAGRAGHPVVFVSVEQSEEELLGRVFCRELQQPISAYWNRDAGYAQGVRAVAHRLPLAKLYLRSDPHIAGEDHQGTVGRIRRWVAEVVEEEHGRHPLVVVDYLQRMRPPEADRRLDERLRISAAGLGLRQLARDFEVPVLVLSSIGRASYEGQPNLGWFKGSGDLEYDADGCIILRPELVALPAGPLMPVQLHLVKSRYGPVTTEEGLRVMFDRGFGTFTDTRSAQDAPRPTAGPRPTSLPDLAS